MQVIIMSGVPGSGKSTFTKGLEKPVICSADNYFMKNGEYQFDVSKLAQAHGECLRVFTHALLEKSELVVVDNTNTTVLEIAPYYALAAAYGYHVKLVTVNCEPETAFARNVHGVPLQGIKAMHKRLGERWFPPFWKMEFVEV